MVKALASRCNMCLVEDCILRFTAFACRLLLSHHLEDSLPCVSFQTVPFINILYEKHILILKHDTCIHRPVLIYLYV